MKITKTRYLNAKKKLNDMQKFQKVVEDWENAVKDCPFKEHVTAISMKDGAVKLECERKDNDQAGNERAERVARQSAGANGQGG